MRGFRVRRAPSLHRTAPGFVVVASVAGRSVEMAGSAAAIWTALPEPDADPLPFDELIEQLVAAHGISAEIAERDASAVLQSLEEIGCAVRFA